MMRKSEHEFRPKPELLSPAGDMERLEAAVRYGADAVYLAGKDYGMRAAPGNFTRRSLKGPWSSAIIMGCGCT